MCLMIVFGVFDDLCLIRLMTFVFDVFDVFDDCVWCV